MSPMEFDISRVPKKVYRRFGCYAAWSRNPKATLWSLALALCYTCVAVLYICGLGAGSDSRDFDLVIITLWATTGFAHLMILVCKPFAFDSEPSYTQRWHFSFDETAVVLQTQGESRRWDYYAMAYAREAPDAFYLVMAEKPGCRHMVLPKEALTEAQTLALRELLTRCMPGGKFTQNKHCRP